MILAIDDRRRLNFCPFERRNFVCVHFSRSNWTPSLSFFIEPIETKIQNRLPPVQFSTFAEMRKLNQVNRVTKVRFYSFAVRLLDVLRFFFFVVEDLQSIHLTHSHVPIDHIRNANVFQRLRSTRTASTAFSLAQCSSEFKVYFDGESCVFPSCDEQQQKNRFHTSEKCARKKRFGCNRFETGEWALFHQVVRTFLRQSCDARFIFFFSSSLVSKVLVSVRNRFARSFVVSIPFRSIEKEQSIRTVHDGFSCVIFERDFLFSINFFCLYFCVCVRVSVSGEKKSVFIV